MMTHYLETKKQYPDCILFYRLGDFYEMFFEDAKTVSRELELTLTGKDCGLEERAPMCGVPFHAVEGYLTRLVQKGYKVAIAEQMEDPKLAKGLVKREVIRVVTPGTIILDSIAASAMLDPESPPITVDKSTFTCARPPGRRPVTTSQKSMILFVTPV